MTNTVTVIATAVLAAVLAERGALLSMRVARRTGFLDRPGGYKAHAASTPYLGGAAVFLAVLIAATVLSEALGHVPVILTCAAMLAVIGTVDDRLTVSPRWRIVAELIAAIAVWSAHRGFTAFNSDALDLIVTVVWVLGIVNAFNLIDNIDGACATLAGVSTTGVGVLAALHGHWNLAAVALAIAGSCFGFLRHNLAKPARIFLGDGGSMPLGFLIACLTMAATRGRHLGVTQLFACGLLAGLPVLDTTLVVISRRRRGLSVLTGGRDHITHRLLARVGTPGRVAMLLALVQGVLVTLAVTGDHTGKTALIVFGSLSLVLGALALVVLESPGWAPPLPPATASAAAPAATGRADE